MVTGAVVAPMRAALSMLASTVSFGLMAITIRLASQSLETTEVAFFRNAFGLVSLLPWVFRPGQPLPRTRNLPRYFVRTLIGLVAMLCGFWAIAHLPLSQAIALSYSTPLFVTIGILVERKSSPAALAGRGCRFYRRISDPAAGLFGVFAGPTGRSGSGSH